jgi:hypothetical protein
VLNRILEFPSQPNIFASLVPGTAQPANSLGMTRPYLRSAERQETDDNEARPTEKGSGDARATVDGTALGGTSSIRMPAESHFDLEHERQDNDGIEVMEADDGRLGLTGTKKHPAEDWAADSGETATPDSES